MSIQDALVSAGEAAITRVAADPTIAIGKQPGATDFDVREAAKVMATEVAPVVQHLTNNEPWYQSRVTWGLIITGVCTVAKPFVGDITPDAAHAADIANALATAGQGIGIFLAWYGRWKATKPLGS